MRELMEFHSPDELRQLVDEVLDDLDVPPFSAGDDAGPQGSITGLSQGSGLADPSTAFDAHGEGALGGLESDFAGESGSLTAGDATAMSAVATERALVGLRGLMAAGIGQAALVDLIFARLLGRAGPWQGQERGFHRVLSRVWEGIAVEYIRSKGAKTPHYKSNVRILVMTSWKAADTLAAVNGADSGPAAPGGAFRGVFVETGEPGRAAEAAGAVRQSSGTGAQAEAGAALPEAPSATGPASGAGAAAAGGASVRAGASAALLARSRAEELFDAWVAAAEGRLRAADEEVRAAERRVRLGRDATAVLDFLAAMKGARGLDRELRAGLAKRCRAAEGALAAVVAGQR